MNKEFITYEQALELKKLGFDVSYFGYYDIIDEYTHEFYIGYKESDNVFTYEVGAPLYQQAFRWFRERYSILLYKDYGKVPHFTIIQNLIFENPDITYEEAELACLKRLIEIVKNK